MKTFSRSLLAAPLLIALSPGLGHSQTPAAPNPDVIELSPFVVAPDPAGTYVQPFSISATRVRVDLLRHPQMINIVSSELIADLGAGASRIAEATRFVAGVNQFSFVEGRFSIRGSFVGSTKRNGFETSNEFIEDMALVEMIEVIKGPPALLYGPGSPGGVINVVTKRPLFREAHTASLSLDDEGSVRAMLDLSGPIVKDKLAYRLIYLHEERNGHSYLEESTRDVLGAMLTWNPTQTTTIHADLMILDQSITSERTQSVPVNSARTAFLRVPRDWSLIGPNGFRDTDDRAVWLTVEQRLGSHWTLRSANQWWTSDNEFFRRNIDAALPGDTTINPTSVARAFGRSADVYQLDLLGSYDFRWGSLQMLLGYTRDERLLEERQWNQGGSAYAANPFPIFEYRSLPLDSPRFARGTNAFVGNPSTAWNDTTQNSNGAYALAQARLFEERLGLFAGVRRDESSQQIVNYLNGSVSDRKEPFNIPQLGVSWSVTPSVSLYAAYSETGSVNSQHPGNPQTGSGTDLGIKVRTEDNRFAASLAIFEIDLTNVQRAVPGTTTTVLSGGERSQGFEAEIFASPAPGWAMIASYAFLDAVVTDDTVAAAIGRRLQFAPEHAFNLWTRWAPKEGPLAGWLAGMGVNYRTEQFTHPASGNNALLTIPGYARFDVLLGRDLEIWGQPVSLRLNIDNLFDRYYFERGSALAPGRTFSFSTSVRF